MVQLRSYNAPGGQLMLNKKLERKLFPYMRATTTQQILAAQIRGLYTTH